MQELSTEVHLPSASRSGKNAYFMGCDVVQQTAAYCSCLNKIELREAKKDDESIRDCVRAMRNGLCKAIGMRKEEKLKGVALYFIPRTVLTFDSEATPATFERTRMPPKKTAKPKVITPDTGDYAAAINASLKRRVLPAMQAGESPMAFARRCAITA